MNRKKIVAGNWKMNTNLNRAKELVTEIKGMLKDEVIADTEVILFPPYPFLSVVASLSKDSDLKTGAQNVSQFIDGAYTGEVSAEMLLSLEVRHTLIGHSERRQYFGENHDVLKAKVDRALDSGMNVIFCCGETLDQRQSNLHFETVQNQLSDSLFHVDASLLNKIVIAYEPVWAIGTGVTASTEQAQEMHAFIRNLVKSMCGAPAAENMRILYGGSVKSSNAHELFSCADIDGGLIGGAALESRSFIDIVKASL
jgi:triosephosphate isomerase